MRYDSPNAAERYFDHSMFGQLHTLLAEAWSGGLRRPQRRDAKRPRGAPPGKPATRRASLLDRLDAWFWRQEQQDREAYLARSRDMFELERRLEALERGELIRYY